WLNVVETFDLVKVFPGVTAVDNLSLVVPERNCFGFLGPNGAGKTTTVKMLTGLTYPTNGTATVFGWSILTEISKIRKVVGYMPEFIPKPKGKALDLLVSLAGLNSSMDKQSLRAQARDLLEMFDLWEVRNRKVHTFSMGMFKKWLLALTLMGEPEVLFLDEPTANLDPVGRVELLDLIKKLGRERTVFINSHVLPEVERVANNFAIINEGKLVIQGTMKQLKETISGGTYTYVVKCSRPEELRGFLESSEDVSSLALEEGKIKLTTRNPEGVWVTLNKAYNEAGITVTEFREAGQNLEEIFLKLIKADEEEAG
ncbi:MAG: ABC transporter ATP-binding protein, partial [Candidatus Freyarchaeota archaeon]